MNEPTVSPFDDKPDRFDDTPSPLEVKPRRVLGWLLATIVALGAWFWWTGAERRAVLRLPAAERLALYERELGTFKSLCLDDPEPALDEQCRARATVLSWLPECDADCMRLISKVIPVGSAPPNPRGLTSP